MSFPRYPKYKNSGVEWLGDVPEHWAVKRLKHQLARNDGGVWGDEPVGDGDTMVLRSTEQTVDGRWQIDDPAFRSLGEADVSAAMLIEGDLLLTKSSGSSLHIGKTSLVDSRVASLKCCYSNFMQRLRLKASFDPKLAWYVLNNEIARLQFDLFSNSTTGLANLNGTIIGQILLPVPPRPEQAAIAAFLDRETSKIDALIAEQQRLIELLQEKRQAVISHAVTKGLNPDVPMKDSGIEWLGEVPENWKCVRNKVVFHEVDDRSETEDGELLTVSHITGVTPRSEKDVNMFMAETFVGYKKCRAGDLVINTMWAWMGALGCAKCDGIVSPSYNVYRPRGSELLWPDYYDDLCRVPSHRTAIKARSTGIWESRLRLYPDAFLGMSMPLPPFEEQQAIAAYVDRQTSQWDLLAIEADRAITLLQERRSALISAAVTGQIDVRSLASSEAA